MYLSSSEDTTVYFGRHREDTAWWVVESVAGRAVQLGERRMSGFMFNLGDSVVVTHVGGLEPGRLSLGERFTVENIYYSDLEGRQYVDVIGGSGSARRVLSVFASRFSKADHVTTATDPKQSHGSAKPPLGLVPLSAEAHIARAMQHGADKYGPFNWRAAQPASYSMMTYLHAQLRHIKAIIDGQDIDPESGEHHMSHVGAGACLFLDAMEQGVLKDDRPPKGKGPEVLARMTKASGGSDAGGK